MSFSVQGLNSARHGKLLGCFRLALYAATVGFSAAYLFGSVEAMAQSKFFSTPNRGGAEGAKEMAMIHTLLEENKQRKNETSDLDGRLGTAEG